MLGIGAPFSLAAKCINIWFIEQLKMKWYNNVFWSSKYHIIHTHRYWDLPQSWSVLNIQNTCINSNNTECNLSWYMYFPYDKYHCHNHHSVIKQMNLNPQINQFQLESQPPWNSAKCRAGGWKKKISILTCRGTFTSHLDGQKVRIWASVFVIFGGDKFRQFLL